MNDMSNPYWQSRWLVEQHGWGAGDYYRQTRIIARSADGSSYVVVATVCGEDDPEAIGIAHLMAAAPDLRDALDAALALIRNVVTEEMLDADPELDEQVRLLEAAASAALGSAGVAGLASTGFPPVAPVPAARTCQDEAEAG